MYNQESEAMGVINRAHNSKGLYVGSRKSKSGGIWLKFKFESHTGRNIFTNMLHNDNMGKGIQLSDNIQCEILV